MGTVGVSMTQRVWHVFNECGMAYLCVSRPQLVWHGVSYIALVGLGMASVVASGLSSCVLG